MQGAKSFHNAALAVLMVLLCACSGDTQGQASARDPSDPATARLKVDAEHWPVDVMDLARKTIKLVQQRGEPGYLTQIDIQLPQKNEGTPLTAVFYTFYLPATHKGLRVSYANTDVSMPAEQMKMAQQAGVADVMRRAQEAVLMPKFEETVIAKGSAAPAPLPGAQITLRDAYALARRHGLTQADHVNLSVSTRNLKAPLVLWNFRGNHTREDSQGIHIDALTGELVDEDRINDLSRAERAAQLQKALQALQSLAQPNSPGGLGSEQTLVNCPTGYVHYGVGRDCYPVSNQVDPAPIQGN
jgi:hypothetical protein